MTERSTSGLFLLLALSLFVVAGVETAANPQVAFLLVVCLVGAIAVAAAPAGAWVLAAVVAALTFKGLVTLGLLPSTCGVLSSPLVSAMREAHPGIRLRITTGYAGTLQQWVESGEVDVALIYGTARSPAIQTKALIEEALWIVAPPAVKLRKGKPVPLASLAGKPLILPSAPHGIRTLVDHACAVSNVELTLSVETNAMSVQKDLVLGGHGLTILPPIAVADDVRRKRLSAAPIDKPKITRTIELALPSNRVIRRHVRCAVDVLVRCVKSAVKTGAWVEARWVGS